MSSARRRSWSPTTPRAASIADRILFLADGVIVKDMAGATASEVIAEMDELSLP